MKNPIRNETSLILVVAVIFSAVAIPVLSGFLEPSQPPAVAAVQIGQPRDDDLGPDRGGSADGQSDTKARERPSAGDAQRRRRGSKRDAPARSTQPAPSAPADDAAEDDGGEAD